MPDRAQTAEQPITCKEVVFTADHAAMIAARESILDFLRDYVAGEQEEIDLMLTLQEALANAVLHGCKSDPSKTVRCAVSIDPSAINIVVRDPGDGFNTSIASDSSDDGSNLSEHGRGIFLMRSLMDEVSYRHQGSELHLKKLRHPAHH